MTLPLLPGDAAPWFQAPALDGTERFAFDTVAGRHVLLLLIASAAGERAREALRIVGAHRALFDDDRACFFGATRDREDAPAGRIARRLPGIRWFLDYEGKIAAGYGAGEEPMWVLLDPMLRVCATGGIAEAPRIFALLRSLTGTVREDGHAPVLVLPRVFEPGFCRTLIERYEAHGGEESGFMRDIDGKTAGILDPRFKRRFDYHIDDEVLRAQIRLRLMRFLIPMIRRSFQFEPTRIERYVVACYDGDGPGGYFRAHRDNTTAGTAHRRFACTINLNADEYEGGDLIFPEFGPRRYRAPTGGAVVFSCSLLHEALPVTRGKRYACLPFLYDEAAARQREEIANSGRVDTALAGYRAG